MAKAAKTDAKITPERLEEALNVRDRLIIELLVQVLDELADHDAELKETIHAVINKL